MRRKHGRTAFAPESGLVLAMSTATVWLVAGGAALAAVVFGALAVVLRRPPAAAHGVALPPANAGDGRAAASASAVPDADWTVARAADEERRLRDAAAFAATLDLNELSHRVLEATVAACGADAAAIGIREPGGEGSLVQAVDLSDAEIGWLSSGLEAKNESAAIMRYPRDGSRPNGDRIRTAVIVPLLGRDGDHVGNLAALWRRDLARGADERLAILEGIAEAAWSAVDNARRFHEVWTLSIRDALTGLFNRRYFLGELAEQAERAHRQGRSLAVLIFDIDDFKLINERLGHSGADALLAEVAARLRTLVRGSDTPCRVGGDEFAAILPDSTVWDAERLFERVGRSLEELTAGDADGASCSGGAAELRPDEDGTALFERAEQCLFDAQQAGSGRVVVAA